MSNTDEDVELQQLLVQTLEKNGTLAKMKAQMRASVYFALEDDLKMNKAQPSSQMKEIQSYLETHEGQTVFFLVKEFLEFFNLKFTLRVFESEAFLDTLPKQYQTLLNRRPNLFQGLDETEVPILHKILTVAQAKTDMLDINLNLNNSSINGGNSVNSSCSTQGNHPSEVVDTQSILSATEQDTTVQYSMPNENNTLSINVHELSVNLSENSLENSGKMKHFNATFNVISPVIKNLNGIEDREASLNGEASETATSQNAERLENSKELKPPLKVKEAATDEEYADDFVSGNASSVSSVSSKPSKQVLLSQGDSQSSSEVPCSNSVKK